MTLVALRWSDIKVFYSKCQPLPIVKRSLPTPFFFSKPPPLPKLASFMGIFFPLMWSIEAQYEEGQIFALKHLSVEVYFAAYAIFRSPWLQVFPLLLKGWPTSLSWDTGRSPAIGHGVRLLRAWARLEFFWGKFSHVIFFFQIFSYGHNGDYSSVYLTTSCLFCFFFLFCFSPALILDVAWGRLPRLDQWVGMNTVAVQKNLEINPLHQC